MIVTQKKSWIRLLFAIRGSTFRHIWPRMLGVFFVAAAATAMSQGGYLTVTLTPVPFTIVGLALAIFLGFRNNAAYDRYWEGRKLWGGLVNVARNFALQTHVLGPAENNSINRATLVRGVIAYVNCLRHRLRGTCPEVEMDCHINQGVMAELRNCSEISLGFHAGSM